MNYESLARTHVDPEPLEFSLRFAKLVATGLWPVSLGYGDGRPVGPWLQRVYPPANRATHECTTRICANFQTS